MRKFIDTHHMGSLTEEQLQMLQDAKSDEFGVTHHDILYSKDNDKVYCVLNAPDRDSVIRHHKHAGIDCDWIEEVKSTRDRIPGSH